MRDNLSKYSDDELIRLLQAEKPESDYAFAEIYDRYGVRINSYIKTIITNRQIAEDIFQETFIKFYQKVRSDVADSSVIGFLITIARNLCLNAKRDAKPTIPIEELEIPVFQNNSLENQEMNDLVMRALDMLDSEFKEAIALRFFNDLPYEDIAEILKITAARARYLVFTGKNKIRTILQPYLNDTYTIK